MLHIRWLFTTVHYYAGLPSPRNFRYILQNYDVSFTWEDPILPNDIKLTSYIISYNVTDAFNEQFNDSIIISGERNNYVFNATCSYETGLALCPVSHYCFTLTATYIKDRTTIGTTPANNICFTTPQYSK